MKKLLVFSLIICFALITGCNKDDDKAEPEGIKYKVAFNLNWNSTDFPVSYPSNAHFSKLIGWSHDSSSTFFQVGTIASSGIEDMAETGGTSKLCDELNNRTSTSEGHHVVVGGGLGSGVGTINIEIIVDDDHPSVTLATMIAPSPDWYVAIVNVNLLNKDGFVLDTTVHAHAYDAGSDNGTEYTSSNEDTNPKQPITILTAPPIGNGYDVEPVIGTVTFTRL